MEAAVAHTTDAVPKSSNSKAIESVRPRTKFHQSSQKLRFYALLGLLFKAEALFYLYVCYINDLTLKSNSKNIKSCKWLPFLWLLKPLCGFINDKLNIKLDNLRSIRNYASNGGNNVIASLKKKVSTKKRSTDSLNNIKNSRDILLAVSEIMMISCSAILLVLYYYGIFDTLIADCVILFLGICLVNTSACAEGLFCKYCRSHRDMTQVEYISVRLGLSAMYGLSAVFCLMYPLIFPEFLFNNLQGLKLVFPSILLSNNLCILWIILGYDSVDSDDMTESEPMKEVKFTLESVVSLLVLLCMLAGIKVDCSPVDLTGFRYPEAYGYVIMFLSQLIKFIVSLSVGLYSSFEGLIKAVMGMFGCCFLLYPFKNHLRIFLSNSNFGLVLFLSIIMSAMQQVLMTYALAICLLVAPRGYESTTTSLPGFVLHSTVLFSQHGFRIKSGMIRLFRKELICDAIFVFVCLYSFAILFDIDRIEALNWRSRAASKHSGDILGRRHLGKDSLETDTDPIWKKLPKDTLSGDSQSTLADRPCSASDVFEPNSPWGLEHDFSDESETI